MSGSQGCVDTFEDSFPNLAKKKWSPMFLCDRRKRDVYFSDDPTEEDMQSFKQTRFSHHRSRRDVLNGISKENATRYCAERISETKIGKLCAKVGVDVEVLVQVCAADVEVSNEQATPFYFPFPVSDRVPYIYSRATLTRTRLTRNNLNWFPLSVRRVEGLES